MTAVMIVPERSHMSRCGGSAPSPISSTEFRSYGERGRVNGSPFTPAKGHTFAVIAGLRLDTTPFDHYTGKWAPRWQTADRPPRGFARGIPSACSRFLRPFLLPPG